MIPTRRNQYRLQTLPETTARWLARTNSRRSFLGRLGVMLVGAGAAHVVLPVARASAQPQQGQDPGDPSSCDYWRHCAIDGYLCGCCGGSATTCPPGTIVSPITWVGTCRNPGDGRDYIISYNDCCGKQGCGRCGCHRNEGDTPPYLPSTSNDTQWCAGSDADIVYNCSIAVIVGVADV